MAIVLLPLSAAVAKPPVSAPPVEVKVGGDGLQTGNANLPAVPVDEFLRRVQDFMSADQPNRAREYISRRPDVALDVLRSTSSATVRDPARHAVAQVYDEHCCRKPGWLPLLEFWADHPKGMAAYEEARRTLLDLGRKGKNREAVNVRLMSTLGNDPPAVLALDAAQLTAEALLRAERPADAVKAIASVVRSTVDGFPHQSAHLLLLLSECRRRCGQEAEAVEAWKSAVDLAVPFLSPPHGPDPSLWEKASYLRPVRSGWPESVARELDRDSIRTVSTRRPGTDVQEDEVMLWQRIGSARLGRGEMQSALLALKRAESWCRDSARRSRLQYDEARALIGMDQTPAALALLTPLASRTDDPMRKPALAMLGAIKFRAGQVQQALMLLRRAVESGNDDWPGLADAEADLALAYLTTGEEEKGLRLLRSARARFEKAGDQTSAQQTIDNERAYMDHRKARPR